MKLQVCFHSAKGYKRVKEYINQISDFYGEPNDEWQMIEVDVEDERDANNSERDIDRELSESGFSEYYFEIED